MKIVEEALHGVVAAVSAFIVVIFTGAIILVVIHAITGFDISAMPTLTMDQTISMSP
jgi:hypothetical protein